MAATDGLNRELKVLFVLDAFPDPQAGTEGQFWLLLNRLDRARIDPGILLLRRSEFLERNVQDVPIKVLDVHRLRSPANWLRIGQAARWARAAGYQIAHIFFNDSALVFPMPLSLSGLRVIVSRRDLGFWYTPGNLRLLRFNTRFIDAVVANCEAVRRVAIAQEGFAERQIQVVYNGIARAEVGAEAHTRERWDIPANAPLLVLVANLRPLKRIDDAVRALASLGTELEPTHLVVVGEDRDANGGGSHRAEIEALAHSLGVAKRVHFTGKLRDPMPLIREAQVCILTSQTEGLSNAIVEYMFAGKPVVCTDAGGNAELVEDGRSGYVVPVGDVPAMASALGRILLNPDLSRSFGERARARALELFSPSRMVDQHQRLYARLAESTL